MRIVLDYRPALRARTGVGELVHELARALVSPERPLGRESGLEVPRHADASDVSAAMGSDVDVVLFTSSWKDRPSDAVRRELAGVRVADHRIPVRSLTWAWNRMGWPPIEMLTGHCDVVHSMTPLVIPARRAAQVVTVHDLDFLHHPERAAAETRRDFPALVADHVAGADHVIVPSRYTAREVERRLAVPGSRITVCSPGPPAWARAVAAERARSADARHILFIGTLEPRKNVGALIAAYRALVSAVADAPPLVLAGRMTAEGVAWQHSATEAGLADRVRFLGYVDDRDRPALYEAAHMLVLPSLEEGFGFPVLEGMACGVPVVISNRGSLPEVAGDAADPIDPDDIDGLAARMRALLDPEHAADAVTRGSARAARYSWNGCATEARRAYRAAVVVRQSR